MMESARSELKFLIDAVWTLNISSPDPLVVCDLTILLEEVAIEPTPVSFMEV
jgi:hypothetical protein